MLQRLEAHELRATGGAGRGRGAALLQTHPLTEDRVENVRRMLPDAYQIYRSSCSSLQLGWQEAARLLG
jgi:predicted Zn-dependent protease